MADEPTRPHVRRAREHDEPSVVPILFESGAALYPRFAGSREAALRILSAAFCRPGNNASGEVITVAELEGRVAGAMAAFPVAEGGPRDRRFMTIALARLPPWRWRRAWRISHALNPTPPPDAMYVDALATAPDARRRGVAGALLAHAEEDARARGLSHLALETELENAPARALYRSAGFEETGRLPPVERGLGEGYVCLVKVVGGRSP